MAFRKRINSFKKTNLSLDFIKPNLTQWMSLIINSQAQLETQELHPAEFTARLLIEIAQKLHGKSWKGASLSFTSESSCEKFKLITENGVKGIPLAVNRALYYWYTGKYPLHLYFYKPTAEQVLELQSKGERCVTVFTDQKDWLDTHDGRDAYSFILHDLIHADHFFAKEDWRLGQLQFYQQALRLWRRPEFQDFITDKQQMTEEIEYIFSDMNSHPEHLKLCLNTVLRNWGYTNNEPQQPVTLQA